MLVPKLLIDASFNTEKEELFMSGSVMLWCLGSIAVTGFLTCGMFWLKRNEDDGVHEDYVWIVWLPVLAVTLG